MAKATFIGTYSTRGLPGAGNGTQLKVYWFLWEDRIANTYLVQRLDSSFSPMGKPALLAPKLFRQHFTREPKVTLVPEIQPEVADYLDKVFKPGQAEEKAVLKSPPPLLPPDPQPYAPKREEAAPAEAAAQPLSPAEQLDKELRAEFAQSIMRFRKGNRREATKVFTKLYKMKDGIVPAHKHMFTDFAVDLRKSQLYDLSLKHFSRAVELSPDDSHANFNMARMLYEMGEYKRALEYIEKTLALEPDMRYAIILKKRILQQ